MSVHCSSRLGYGFIVKRQEYRELSNEKFDEFHLLNYVFAINAFDPDTFTYFCGLIIDNADLSEYFMVLPVASYDHDKFMEMMDEYKSYFPYQESCYHR